jgi:hypothetical protein
MAIDPIGSANRTTMSQKLRTPIGLAIIGVISIIIGGTLLGTKAASSAGGIILPIGIALTVLGILNAFWKIFMEI